MSEQPGLTAEGNELYDALTKLTKGSPVVASSEHGTLVCVPRSLLEAWAKRFYDLADMVEFGGDIFTEATIGENSVRDVLEPKP